MALTPEDSRAVAKAIQDAMSSAMKSMRLDRAAEDRTPRNQAATAPKVKKPAAAKDKVILAAAASLKTLEDRADDASDSLKVMSKTANQTNASLGVFRTGVQKAAVSLRSTRTDIGKIDFSKVAGDVSRAITDAINSAKVASLDPEAETAAIKFGNLVENQVNTNVIKFGSSLTHLTNYTRLAAKYMKETVRQFREVGILKPGKGGDKIDIGHDPTGTSTPTSTKRTSAEVAEDEAAEELKDQRKKQKDRDKELAKEGLTFGDSVHKVIERRFEAAGFSVEKSNKMFGLLSTTLGAFRALVSTSLTSAIEMVDDKFQVLAARGIDSSVSSLMSLYWEAGKAGMSLRDYAQFMDKNMIAVSRASSFSAFQANLKIGTDALKKFGVFGDEANQLAGAMMSSSTALGVPQAQMGDAIRSQLKVFDKLRLSTSITAQEFEQMTRQLGEDAQVRTELSALDPKEAVMRQAAILDQMSYARSLNLSTSEVQKYTAAILEQRKSTVKQRFQQANRLTQAAGLLGMGGGQAEELRSLSMNRYKTDEQQQRYMDLLGQVNTGLEQMQQRGGPGSQYQSDTMREMLDSSGLSQALEAASAIRAGKQSGDVGGNRDIGKKLDGVDRSIGTIITQLDGMMKNPLGHIGASIVGGLAAIATGIIGFSRLGTVMGTTAGNIIAGLMSKTGIIGKPAPTPGNPYGTPDDFVGPQRPEKGGWARGKGAKWGGRAFGAAGIIAGSAAIYGAVNDYNESAKIGDEQGENSEEAKTKQRAGNISAVAGVASSIGSTAMMLAPFLGPAAPFVMVGGAIVTGLGTLGGVFADKIAGWMSSSDDAKKAQDKNTKVILKANKLAADALRADASPNSMYDTNLDQFGAEAVRTGQAMRTNTAGEQDNAANAQLSPEELMTKYTKPVNDEMAKVTKDQRDRAKVQAANELKATLKDPDQEPDQAKVDKLAEENLRKQALAKVLTQVKKKNDADTLSTANDPTKTLPGTEAPNGASINGPQVSTPPNPLINYSGLPFNPYAQNKAPGSAFGPVDPRTQTAVTAAAAAAVAASQPPKSVVPAPATAAAIATPASQPPKSVVPATVNNGEKDAKTEADRKASATQAAAALVPPGVQDPAEVLKQILDILKQSLIAETQQVGLSERILQSQALMPTQPDKAAAWMNTVRQ
jgi:hypothetical protein